MGRGGDGCVGQATLGLYKDGLYLYRHMISPGVPNLCFLGSEVSTFNSVLTHGLQALWLTRLLTGQTKLPTRSEMLADVTAQRRWRCKVMPGQRQRGSSVMLYMQDYHDQLVKDMGASPRRKTGPLKALLEVFKPYTAADYEGLFEAGLAEGEHARERRSHSAASKSARAAAAKAVRASMHSVPSQAAAAAPGGTCPAPSRHLLRSFSAPAELQSAAVGPGGAWFDGACDAEAQSADVAHQQQQAHQQQLLQQQQQAQAQLKRQAQQVHQAQQVQHSAVCAVGKQLLFLQQQQQQQQGAVCETGAVCAVGAQLLLLQQQQQQGAVCETGAVCAVGAQLLLLQQQQQQHAAGAGAGAAAKADAASPSWPVLPPCCEAHAAQPLPAASQRTPSSLPAASQHLPSTFPASAPQQQRQAAAAAAAEVAAGGRGSATTVDSWPIVSGPAAHGAPASGLESVRTCRGAWDSASSPASGSGSQASFPEVSRLMSALSATMPSHGHGGDSSGSRRANSNSCGDEWEGSATRRGCGGDGGGGATMTDQAVT
ncbi:hypothetical protein FOA52_013680 [Chlamydomonas sp. UWO 241]|nr:hypothetical protein FOA52_013680 [Chlamydomonas sp. UWO 241]